MKHVNTYAAMRECACILFVDCNPTEHDGETQAKKFLPLGEKKLPNGLESHSNHQGENRHEWKWDETGMWCRRRH